MDFELDCSTWVVARSGMTFMPARIGIVSGIHIISTRSAHRRRPDITLAIATSDRRHWRIHGTAASPSGGPPQFGSSDPRFSPGSSISYLLLRIYEHTSMYIYAKSIRSGTVAHRGPS